VGSRGHCHIGTLDSTMRMTWWGCVAMALSDFWHTREHPGTNTQEGLPHILWSAEQFCSGLPPVIA